MTNIELHNACKKHINSYLLVRAGQRVVAINPRIANLRKSKKDIEQELPCAIDSIVRTCSFQEYVSKKIGFILESEIV